MSVRANVQNELNRQEVSHEVITLDTSSSAPNGHNSNGPSSVIQAKIESKVAEAPKDKSKPVSSTPVDKTPW